MNRPLTNQQQAVYDFIRAKIVARGYGPTVREIGEHMNIKSPNGVMCHLRALERKGMLTRTANKSRAIELTEPVSRLMGGSLPSQGRVAGGICVAASEAGEFFDLAELVAAERYVLEVRDDSLVDAQINIGDRLIVQRQATATPGQLVLTRIGELVRQGESARRGDTSLRYWMPENGRIRLQPVHRLAPAIVVDQAEVVGVVVGLVRLFETTQRPTATSVSQLT